MIRSSLVRLSRTAMAALGGGGLAWRAQRSRQRRPRCRAARVCVRSTSPHRTVRKLGSEPEAPSRRPDGVVVSVHELDRARYDGVDVFPILVGALHEWHP